MDIGTAGDAAGRTVAAGLDYDDSIWSRDDLWEQIRGSLLAWVQGQQHRRRRHPGGAPGSGVTTAKVLDEITRLKRHPPGAVSRRQLAVSLCISHSTVKRLCRQAGLHGTL